MHRLTLAAFLALACIPAAEAQEGSPSTDRRVVVYRGSAAAPAHPAPAKRASAALVGGSRLWVLDQGRDRLVACRLVRTASVGRSRIRCTQAHLDLAPSP
jgi:hypothetical protein